MAPKRMVRVEKRREEVSRDQKVHTSVAQSTGGVAVEGLWGDPWLCLGSPDPESEPENE